MENTNIQEILAFATLMLFVAILIGLVTRRYRLPYTVGLVLIGLAISLVTHSSILAVRDPFRELVNSAIELITPDFILGLLVTPLIFESAFHLNWDNLRRDLVLILTLAIPGVAVTSLLVGGIVYLGEGILGIKMPFPVALLFGAMMAATDPVAVIALFRSMGLPRRLQMLLEGESLFNDGTAIVVFSLISSIAVSSTTSPGMYRGIWFQFLIEFIQVAGGGILVGLILGWLISQFINMIDDYLNETALTTVLAFGAFLVAEELHVSGVLAVVVAGLVNGNASPKGMSPTTHILVTGFWEYAAFVSNSIIFLLIGLEIDPTRLFTISSLQPILLAILAVLMARAAVIYGLSWVGKDIPGRWRHVLFWGGVRGAISLVLALSLPKLGSWVVDLQNMAFAVVLYTILVQGFTMGPMIHRLRLVERSEMQEEYERRHARAVAARAAYEHLKTMCQEGLFSNHTWELLSPLLKEHSEKLAEAVKEVLQVDPSVEAEELDTARREVLRAQRSALIGLLSDGVISEKVYSQLARGVDIQLSRNQEDWINLIKEKVLDPLSVTHLMAAIVQVQDVENAINALNEAGLSVTRLPSTGGFLGRRNVTLLIGFAAGQEQQIVESLAVSCRCRVEYLASPIEGMPYNLPPATPVTVGGATLFTLAVDRYEVL
ncbi:MAG: cyclic-di-AMP receptor [Anaerolineales bacterium]|nr:cyclic-di-AMP receptor [Anaerolineales bacterium]